MQVGIEDFIQLRRGIESRITRAEGLIGDRFLEEAISAVAHIKGQIADLDKMRDPDNEVHDRVMSRLNYEVENLESGVEKASLKTKQRSRKKAKRSRRSGKKEIGAASGAAVFSKSPLSAGTKASKRSSVRRSARMLPPDQERVRDVLRLIQRDHRNDLSELHYGKVVAWLEKLENGHSVDEKMLKWLNNRLKEYKLYDLFDPEEVNKRVCR
jgi:hypothetical protein